MYCYNSLITLLIVAIFMLTGCKQSKQEEQVKHEGTGDWEPPLTKMGRFNSPLVEVEPFIFNNELYLLENWRSGWEWPGQPENDAGKNNEMWIAHLPNGPDDYKGRKYISSALNGNTLGTAIAWENRVYVFGVNEESKRKYVEMTWSEDLKSWSPPVKVFDSPAGSIFNVSLTRDDRGFVFLWETNGVGTPFTMCFGRIGSLMDNWNNNIIEKATYGEQKYTGGPEIIYAGGWYYLLYLESLEKGWETRITRSRDLIIWQDAPVNRPFITFDPKNKNLPLHEPEVGEINASDPGLIDYGDHTIVYFTGGIQQKGGDLQWARYKGTIEGLMEKFYE